MAPGDLRRPTDVVLQCPPRVEFGNDGGMPDNREFDVTLFGCTGFTGGLIAEYLCAAAPSDARLALAGRDRTRVEQVAARLERDVSLIEADATDALSLAGMAEATRVLISTVGPYTIHGEPVVKACAEAGTDYVDLTGEPEFVDLMYLKYHEVAVESGARLIHACGFDSIPHDLGVQFTVEQLPEEVPLDVRGYVSINGSFSGGTMASALEAMSRMRESKQARRARIEREGPIPGRTVRIIQGRPGKSTDTGRWAIPMPTVDPQIVMDSARRLDRYGPDFRYRHALDAKNLFAAVGMVAGVGTVAALAQFGPSRTWLGSRVAPGSGPSPEKRATSWFKVRFFGEGGGATVVTEVQGGDPGYGETAKMISESALCLAFDELATTSGQQTTASAMGAPLRARLEIAGITFRVLPPGTRGEPIS